MNLHRSGRRPQWESVPIEDRNLAQQIGAATNSIVTPGNAISVIGAGLVGSGFIDIAKGATRKGFTKVAFGRFADLLDGIAAEHTGTKSPLGEAVDVTIDKLALITGLPLCIAKGIAPKSFGVAVGVQTAVNGYYTAKAKACGNEIHTNKEGKYSTVLQWAAISAYGVSRILREDGPDRLATGIAERSAHVLALASLACGALSVVGYRRDALAVTPTVNASPAYSHPTVSTA